MATPSLNLKKVNEDAETRRIADEAQRIAGNAQGHSDHNRTLIMAILWVAVVGFVALLVTFGAMMQSYIADKTNSYQSLVDKVTEQSIKTDLLYQLETQRQITPSNQVIAPIKK